MLSVWFCHVTFMLLPCYLYAFVMLPLCFCHVICMLLSCYLYAFFMLPVMLPLYFCHVICMLLSCYLYVFVMLPLCFCHVTCMLLSCYLYAFVMLSVFFCHVICVLVCTPLKYNLLQPSWGLFTLLARASASLIMCYINGMPSYSHFHVFELLQISTETSRSSTSIHNSKVSLIY